MTKKNFLGGVGVKNFKGENPIFWIGDFPLQSNFSHLRNVNGGLRNVSIIFDF